MGWKTHTRKHSVTKIFTPIGQPTGDTASKILADASHGRNESSVLIT
jgi:hypothetical protein